MTLGSKRSGSPLAHRRLTGIPDVKFDGVIEKTLYLGTVLLFKTSAHSAPIELRIDRVMIKNYFFSAGGYEE